MSRIAVRVRPATLEDSRFLLALRNDETIRRHSRSTGVVTPETHEQWLESALADPERHLYVIESDAGPAGQLRLDQSDFGAEVSIAVAPSARGQGVAATALVALRQIAPALGIQTLTAFVKESNAASLRSFSRAATPNEGAGTG